MMNKIKEKSFDEINFVYYALSLLATVLIITYLIISSNLKQDNREIELEDYSVKITKKFNQIIGHTENIMNIIGSVIQQDPQNKEYINKTLNSYVAYPDIQKSNLSWTIFSWVDETGFLTVDSIYGILEEPLDLNIRDYIQPTRMHPGKFQIGQPVIGSTSKKWMIAGGVGINNKQNKYLGSLVVGLEIKTLLGKLQDIIDQPNIDIFLLDRNLNILTNGSFISLEEYHDQSQDNYFLTELMKNSHKNRTLEESNEYYNISELTPGYYLVVARRKL